MIFDTDGIRYDSSGQNDGVVCSLIQEKPNS